MTQEIVLEVLRCLQVRGHARLPDIDNVCIGDVPLRTLIQQIALSSTPFEMGAYLARNGDYFSPIAIDRATSTSGPIILNGGTIPVRNDGGAEYTLEATGVRVTTGGRYHMTLSSNIYMIMAQALGVGEKCKMTIDMGWLNTVFQNNRDFTFDENTAAPASPGSNTLEYVATMSVDMNLAAGALIPLSYRVTVSRQNIASAATFVNLYVLNHFNIRQIRDSSLTTPFGLPVPAPPIFPPP